MSSGEIEATFECDTCDIQFDSKDNLLVHLTLDHSSDTGVCEYCNKEIDDPIEYIDHLTTRLYILF